MAPLVVEGIYRDGRIELSEPLSGVPDGTRVRVECAKVGESGEDEERERLRQAAFAQMKEGINLGGPPYPKREELYEDRFRRYDRPTG